MKMSALPFVLTSFFLVFSPSAAELQAFASQCSGGTQVVSYRADGETISPLLYILKDDKARFLFYRTTTLQVIDNINCLDHLIFTTGDGASRLMAMAFTTDKKGTVSVTTLPGTTKGYWGSRTTQKTIIRTHANDERIKDVAVTFQTPFGFPPPVNNHESPELQSVFEIDDGLPIQIEPWREHWPPRYADPISGAVLGPITVMGACYIPFGEYQYSVIGYVDEAKKPRLAVFDAPVSGMPEQDKPGVYRPFDSGRPLAPRQTFDLPTAATSTACHDGTIYLFGSGQTTVLSAKTHGLGTERTYSFSIAPLEKGKTVPVGTTDSQRKEKKE